MDAMLTVAVSYIKSSKHRLEIMKELDNGIKTPADIQQRICLRINHVSMYLKGLREKQLVCCLNEESKKGRLYTITELGRKALKVVSKGGE